MKFKGYLTSKIWRHLSRVVLSKHKSSWISEFPINTLEAANCTGHAPNLEKLERPQTEIREVVLLSVVWGRWGDWLSSLSIVSSFPLMQRPSKWLWGRRLSKDLIDTGSIVLIQKESKVSKEGIRVSDYSVLVSVGTGCGGSISTSTVTASAISSILSTILSTFSSGHTVTATVATSVTSTVTDATSTQIATNTQTSFVSTTRARVVVSTVYTTSTAVVSTMYTTSATEETFAPGAYVRCVFTSPLSNPTIYTCSRVTVSNDATGGSSCYGVPPTYTGTNNYDATHADFDYTATGIGTARENDGAFYSCYN